jgi:hypothetical protein
MCGAVRRWVLVCTEQYIQRKTSDNECTVVNVTHSAQEMQSLMPIHSIETWYPMDHSD